MLEKGPRLRREQLAHDEVSVTCGYFFVPYPEDEPHMVAYGAGQAQRSVLGWIANCVGGGTVHMSGFFLRLKPDYFRMHTLLGDVPGTTIADWPITYELAPFYDCVERVIGVSGRAGINPFKNPAADRFLFPRWRSTRSRRRSTPSASGSATTPFRFPAPSSRPRSATAAAACTTTSAAVTAARWGPKAAPAKRFCRWPRPPAVARFRPGCMAYEIEVNAAGLVTGVLYFDDKGRTQRARGRTLVVACSAVELARLLLNSRSAGFPDGLANANGLVGQNLTFSNHRDGLSRFDLATDRGSRPWLRDRSSPFIHRCVQDFYYWPRKDCPRGGTIASSSPTRTPSAMPRRRPSMATES